MQMQIWMWMQMQMWMQMCSVCTGQWEASLYLQPSGVESRA